MGDYSPEALTLAAIAIHDADCRDRNCSGAALGHCYKLARGALEAAALPLGAHVAGKILAHMEAHGPKPLPAEFLAASRWRRHFRIAAQIASRAFLTGEDEKRLAAEALARGEFVACDLPEEQQ